MLNYVDGDATYPIVNPPAVIAHICNNKGVWAKGFVMSINQRWKTPEMIFRMIGSNQKLLTLGDVQFVCVDNNIWVANMVAQDGLRSVNGRPLVQYDKLMECLNRVRGFSSERGASIHMPRIGTGLGRGKWEIIEEIVTQSLSDKGLDVYVYTKKV